MRNDRIIIKIIIWVVILASLLTVFFYVHESFPKPLRALTALLGTPVAVASGISHYTKLGIPVYETPWAVVLTNLLFSVGTVLSLRFIIPKLCRKKG
jgi:hypothetical protein